MSRMSTRSLSEAIEAFKSQLITALEDKEAVERIKLIFEPVYTSRFSPVTTRLTKAVGTSPKQWRDYAKRMTLKTSGFVIWSEMWVIYICVWMTWSNMDGETLSGSSESPRPRRAQPMKKFFGCAITGWSSTLHLPWRKLQFLTVWARLLPLLMLSPLLVHPLHHPEHCWSNSPPAAPGTVSWNHGVFVMNRGPEYHAGYLDISDVC